MLNNFGKELINMASNKATRELMYQLYGKKCMLCGYKPKRSFTKKKCRNPLTYHHMIEKSEGGEATVENGAILCTKCHTWFNKQSKQVQRQMNNYFRKYKMEHLKF